MTLQKYLDRNGIPAEAFARKIGVTFSSVYKYRAGTRNPRLKTMMKIFLTTDREVSIYDWPSKRKTKNGKNGESLLARRRRRTSKGTLAR